MPSEIDLAVETFVDPIDLPLINIGEKVRIQFDGWPAIVFSGWPNASYGTYGGEVVAIETFISDNGKYRILLAPDPDDHPWPSELRVGSGANTMALLEDVPIWFELWRQLNGFPPNYYEPGRQGRRSQANKSQNMRPLAYRSIVVLLLVVCMPAAAQTQESVTAELEFVEYMGYVRKYHPVVRQAELRLAEGAASLMKARGRFDPKIEVDYERKKFKGTEYWDRLNSTFKIPTWYGIEFKANYEQNQGAFISSDETVPDEGLFGAGVSVSLAQGLWINKRMASLKKARFFREQTRAEQQLLVNEVLTEAAVAYFDWVKAYRDYQIFGTFLQNAEHAFRA